MVIFAEFIVIVIFVLLHAMLQMMATRPISQERGSQFDMVALACLVKFERTLLNWAIWMV